MVFEFEKKKIVCILGSNENIKVTYKDDIYLVKELIKKYENRYRI